MIELLVIVKGIDGGCNGSNGPGASTAKRGKKVTTAEANPTDATTKLAIAAMTFQCRFHHGDFCCGGGGGGGGLFNLLRPFDLGIALSTSAENASVFCGSSDVSATRYSRAKNVYIILVVIPELKLRNIQRRLPLALR